MKKIEDHIEAVEILKNELPECFKRGDKKLPLAVGIHASVLKHYRGDDRFDTAILKEAIHLYCKGTKYLSTITEGNRRIDIKGKSVSTVKKSDENYVLKVLSERKAKRKSKEIS